MGTCVPPKTPRIKTPRMPKETATYLATGAGTRRRWQPRTCRRRAGLRRPARMASGSWPHRPAMEPTHIPPAASTARRWFKAQTTWPWPVLKRCRTAAAGATAMAVGVRRLPWAAVLVARAGSSDSSPGAFMCGPLQTPRFSRRCTSLSSWTSAQRSTTACGARCTRGRETHSVCTTTSTSPRCLQSSTTSTSSSRPSPATVKCSLDSGECRAAASEQTRGPGGERLGLSFL
mmetsp:Transcript_149085/g.211871  ORF Transcript_149085/g.211871 Transcript_149085/m.211871 type:complete len:232 (+) Transcript_149085:91-786(+)